MNTKIYSNSCVNKKICFNKKNKKTMSKKRKKVRKKKEVNVESGFSTTFLTFIL